MKLCPKCGITKPFTDFHKRCDRKIGVQSHCIECQKAARPSYAEMKERSDAWREKNRDKINAQKRARRNTPEAKLKRAQEYLANKEKIKQQSAAWYQANREKVIARTAAYNKENADAVRARQKAWIEKNWDHVKSRSIEYTLKNKEWLDKKNKEWKKNNMVLLRVYASNRRARERNAEGTFTRDDVKALLLLQKKTCIVCRQHLTEYHVDHKVPLHRGGTNDPSNLQILCPTCNVRKGAKDPIEFMQEQGFLL